MSAPDAVSLGVPPHVLRLEPSVAGPTVVLDVEGLRATRTLVFVPESREEESLTAFFRQLAAAWRGWDGTRTWGDLAGTVRLSATHDHVGAVELFVELNPLWGDRPPFPGEWVASAILAVEPGRLDRLASEVEALLGQGARRA